MRGRPHCILARRLLQKKILSKKRKKKKKKKKSPKVMNTLWLIFETKG